MVNLAKIRGLLAENHITYDQMAEKIGISTRTFWSKMQTGKFGVDECEIMIRELHIEDPISIFFANIAT